MESARPPSSYGNHLAGQAVPAAAGGLYERRSPLPPPQGGASPSLGRWPRSGAADAIRALDLAAGEGRAWSELRPHQRGQVLRAAARRLAAVPDPEGLVAACLGLSPGELVPHTLGLEGKLLSAEREGLARGESPGIVLVRPHWSLFFAGLGSLLVAELAAGQRVVLLPGPEVPALADRMAEVLAAAGLPAGALAVLHDDGRNALRAALDRGRATRLVAVGPAEEEVRLARWIEGGATEQELPFGAGVVESSRPRLEFRALGVSSARVERGDDPVQQARRIALAALGRSMTLSGQLPGHVRRVVCHPRLLSRFTEELLALLEGDPELDDPLPLLDGDLPAALDGVREVGLAEGATLIHEGGPASPGASRGRRRGATLTPLVFTNVEPRMRLASWSRPAPLVLLMRGGAEGSP